MPACSCPTAAAPACATRAAARSCRATVDYGDVHDVLPERKQDRAQGYALLCQAKPLSDLTIEVAEIDAGEAIRPKYMPARILDLQRAADDVMIVKLGLPMNEPTLFRAGQYVDFVQARWHTAQLFDRLHAYQRRPAQPWSCTSGTCRAVGLPIGCSVSCNAREMHKIEAPLGSFFLRDKSDKPMVMVASGTGFAPIMSMINDSLQRGLTRPISLYWGGRRREDLYMMAQCEAWARQHSHIEFIPVVSEATAKCAWTGRSGFVHQRGHGRFSRHVGPSGVRLRRAGDGRFCAAGLHCRMRPAGRRIFCRRVLDRERKIGSLIRRSTDRHLLFIEQEITHAAS